MSKSQSIRTAKRMRMACASKSHTELASARFLAACCSLPTAFMCAMGIALAAAGFAEAAPVPTHASCADAGAGDAGLVTKDWVSMHAKQCFAHRLPASAACPTSYRSQAIAQSECLASAACSGVYRPLGGGVFFLCDAQHPLQQSAEGGVVLRKTRAAAQAAKARRSSAVGERKPGQAQAGKWCSNWWSWNRRKSSYLE